MIQVNQQTISPSPAPLGPAPAMPRVRILVVDDDDEFRESLSLNLMDEGFAVTTFAIVDAELSWLCFIITTIRPRTSDRPMRTKLRIFMFCSPIQARSATCCASCASAA